MTTLKSKLKEDLTTAMKARDELTSSTLRLTLTAITKEEVSGKTSRELSDDEVQKVIAKEAKKRREAAEAFAQGGRTEQAEREKAEGELLDAYLPKQLSDDELGAIVASAVDEAKAMRRRGAAGDGRRHEDREPEGRGARGRRPGGRRGEEAPRGLSGPYIRGGGVTRNIPGHPTSSFMDRAAGQGPFVPPLPGRWGPLFPPRKSGGMLTPGNGSLPSPLSRLLSRPLPGPSSVLSGGSGMSMVLNDGAGSPLRAFVMASRQIGPGTWPPYTLSWYTPPMVTPSISTLWDGLPTQTAPDMFGV